MTDIEPGILAAILIPVALVELGLVVFALVDLIRRPAAEVNGNKWAWGAAIVLLNPLGSIAYLFAGRRDS